MLRRGGPGTVTADKPRGVPSATTTSSSDLEATALAGAVKTPTKFSNPSTSEDSERTPGAVPLFARGARRPGGFRPLSAGASPLKLPWKYSGQISFNLSSSTVAPQSARLLNRISEDSRKCSSARMALAVRRSVMTSGLRSILMPPPFG